MPDFTHWADLPPAPENSMVTPERIRQALGDSASPPLLARLIGFSDERKINAVRYSVQRSQDALIDRTLTDDELNALARYASQEGDTQINDHAIVAGAALGMTLWGRKTMRFPLWRAPDMAMFRTFPSATQPWLRGRNARRAWHFARFATYYIGSSVTVGSFLGFMSTRAALTNKAVDPRLRNFLGETILDPQNQEILLMLQKERNVEPIHFRRQDDPWVIRAREIRRNRFYEEASKNMKPEQREALEQRRRRAEEAEDEWRQRVIDTKNQRNSPVNSPDSVWAQRRGGLAPSAKGSVPPSSQNDEDPFALDEDDDEDMSPVPAHIRKQEQAEHQKRQQQEWQQSSQQQDEGQGQMSAWDRLRERASQDSAPPASGAWGPSMTTPTDSGAWSASAESGHEQSQKEFDSLQSERRHGQQTDSKWR
ncbi:hypothetical protein BROUX41_003472 [Berkeleyomyces rouxiae]